MQLNTSTIPATPARVEYAGAQGNIIVSAGQTLTIETSPEGTEILNAEAPAGKEWTVTLRVDVQETDV